MRARSATALAALLTVIAGGAATYSLWNEDALQGTDRLRSGELDITLTGGPRWQETPASRAGLPIDPSEFRAMPGDTFTVTQALVTVLRGDNIAGELTVRWADARVAEQLPAGVSATYTIQDDGGAPATGATPLGASVTVPELPPGETTWSVSITLVLDEVAAPLYVDPSSGQGVGDAAASVRLGEVILELDQVRPAGSKVP